jgi:hypothetical protein
VSNDVRIRGYFSKPSGVCEQIFFRKSALKEMFKTKKNKCLKKGEKGNWTLRRYFFAFHKIILCLPNQGTSDVGACTDV